MAEARAEEAEHAAEDQLANRRILAEVLELRAELAAMRTELVGADRPRP
jgi:voltage-gated sodium channel